MHEREGKGKRGNCREAKKVNRSEAKRGFKEDWSRYMGPIRTHGINLIEF